MRQTRALPLVQGLKVPIRHRALHVSGNSAAVESFAASYHGGKYGVTGVLTFLGLEIGRASGWCSLELQSQYLAVIRCACEVVPSQILAKAVQRRESAVARRRGV